jgi:hypothetical protein
MQIKEARLASIESTLGQLQLKLAALEEHWQRQEAEAAARRNRLAWLPAGRGGALADAGAPAGGAGAPDRPGEGREGEQRSWWGWLTGR